jgi:hypothetical protein
MTRRYCDTGRIDCPHLPECIWDCKYDNATVRKVKPYPIVPEDIPPVPEAWQIIGSVLVGFGIVALAVICILLFFTGVWIWSLLI